MDKKSRCFVALFVLVVAILACNAGGQVTQEVVASITPPAIPTDAELTSTVTPTGEPTVEVSPGPAQGSGSQGCTNRIDFVSDVTVPDNTQFNPNAAFTKTWRLRNSGTCTWTTGYSVVYAGGHLLEGPRTQSLAREVRPSESVDISVSLKAPADRGNYQANWLMRSSDGALFGMGSNGDYPFWVKITVRPAPTTATTTPTVTSAPEPTITHWRGEYYTGRDLAGSPALIRNDVVIDFNWVNASPDSRLPSDNFSVRWTRTMRFDAGLYRFQAAADDGIRVWVGSDLIIDAWRESAYQTHSVDRTMPRGDHKVTVEYYERGGDARVAVSWIPVTVNFADWKGEYWPNRDQSGSPTVVRNDARVNFDWGSKSPANEIPMDDFSARWTRNQHFDAGTYRFSLSMDDGARLWIDGEKVIDEWKNGPSRTRTVDVRLSSGRHSIRVDYFERGGNASIQLRWEPKPIPVTPTSTSKPTETGVPTSTATVTPTLTPTLTPTVTPTNDPEPEPEEDEGAIAGIVWQDICAMTGLSLEEGEDLPEGCNLGVDGLLWGNGLLAPDEPPMTGLIVSLSHENCNEEPFLTDKTDIEGFYRFDGLGAGTYCVTISTMHPTNEAKLLPGVWTFPDRPGTWIVTLVTGNDREVVNFAWDFELIP